MIGTSSAGIRTFYLVETLAISVIQNKLETWGVMVSIFENSNLVSLALSS
jgi:hypothetical protein